MSARYTGRFTPALTHLCAIAEALGPLVDRVVFIGGAIAPLLQTHPISPRVRPTKDVDGLAITASYGDFDRLQEDLRGRGFQQRAIESAESVQIERLETATLVVRHASAPAFLGLKWAAYQDRGQGDLFGSHDIEDLLAVIASRPALVEECAVISQPRLRVTLGHITLRIGVTDVVGDSNKWHGGDRHEGYRGAFNHCAGETPNAVTQTGHSNCP